MNIILIILVGVIGFVIGRKSIKAKSSKDLKKIRKEAHKALNDRTEERKAQVLEMMKDEVVRQKQLDGCNIENGKKGITRKDVERRLGISATTALKYLNELEKDGEVKQIGKAGEGVYYELIN